jgi:hypothetical protein
MNYSGKPSSRPNWRGVYSAPIAVGALCLSGLVSALLFGGIGSYFSWIGVGSPIVIVLYVLATRSRKPL